MLQLRRATDPAWLSCVLDDFDAFLVDHAACERKASATGMSLVVKYPDRVAILEPLIEFAREELEHFHIVYQLMAARGLTLAADSKDEYVNALRSQLRTGSPQLLLDRLLVAGVVEARGCERLGMVTEAIPEAQAELKRVYRELTRAESRHHGLFFRLARSYYELGEVERRAAELLDFEAEVVANLQLRPAVH